MAIDTKPNLSCEKFEQLPGETLNLSGCTHVYGEFKLMSGATISVLDSPAQNKALITSGNGQAAWSVLPVTNGLSLNNNNAVGLGGCMTTNTNIDLCDNQLFIYGRCTLIGMDNGVGNDNCLMLYSSGATIFLRDGCITIESCAGDCLRMQSGFTQFYSATGGGIKYEDNYSGAYTNRSLVDKGWVLSQMTGGTATAISGERITKSITQSSHGFAVQDILGWSGGTYNKAIANGTYDGEVVGIVSKYVNANNFELTQAGYITGLTGLVTNTTYFLSDATAGLMTATEPTTDGYISRAVFIANSTTSGWVLPYPGYVISSGSTGGIVSANNGLNLNGNSVELGGTLCCNTDINVASQTLTIRSNPACIYLTSGGVDIKTSPYNLISVASPSAGGGINILASGTTYGVDMILYGSGMRVADCGSGYGIQYKDNYSATFCDRSLVDKRYVDAQVTGGTVYSLNSPSTCTVGGTSPGYVLAGKTLQCIIQDAFAPYIVPTFSAFDFNVTSPIEVGAALSGTKTFTWTTTTSGNVGTNTIGIREVGGSMLGSGLANDGSEALGIGTKTNTSPTTWTWQISGCSTQNNTFTRNVSKCSIYPVYYGKLTSGGRPPVTNSLVTGGTKTVVNSTGTVTVSFGSSASEYTWLAIPATSTSKTCWYRTALDNGTVNVNPTDKYPDECSISITSGCWSSVNYKVYMSLGTGEISTAMEFRNS